MSRSGYVDDMGDNWQLIRWRGAVASAMRGKRGQSLLREALSALDAMPEKRLIAHELREYDYSAVAAAYHGLPPQPVCGVCTLGAVGMARGVHLEALSPDDHATLGATFDVAAPLIQEIEWMNDEGGAWNETPEQRWKRIRRWLVKSIKSTSASSALPGDTP